MSLIHCRFNIYRTLGTLRNLGPAYRVSLSIVSPVRNLSSAHPKREKEKYDQLLREQIIRATLQHGMPVSAPSPGISQQMKSAAKVLAKTYGILVAIYILLQILMANKDKEDSNGIFIPVVLKLSRSGFHQYQFPHDLRYLDKEAYNHFAFELKQFPDGSLDSYNVVLQYENIKYQVLEQLSKHHKIKHLMGIPIFIENGPIEASDYVRDTFGFNNDFNIWVEVKTPVISGPQISLEDGLVLWKVKSLGFGESSIQRLFSLMGKTLDQIESLDRILAIPETTDLPNDHIIEKSGIKKAKDYNIYYVGEFNITDKTKKSKARIVYVGTIDFNHLSLNRGVKLLSMKLIMQDETYKLLW